MPVMQVLARMESTGVLLDVGRLERLAANCAENINRLTKETYAIVGEQFNINSAAQLQAILFEKLSLPVLDRSKSGQPSTSEDVLNKIVNDAKLKRTHAKGTSLAAAVLDYRRYTKLKSTWLDSLPRSTDPTDSRVRCTFNQATTSTGRLSSSSPNLQNIPARTKEGREVREAFVAPNGHKMLSADYSQIELRIMANFSRDKSLVEAFREGKDVHKATASQAAVTAEMRRRAKTINFGLIYGMSSFGLAAQLGVKEPEARGMISRYFRQYPGVQAYMNRTLEEARKRGYVETLLGRRIHVPGVNSPRLNVRKGAERLAINAPVQGSAVDLIKIAMVNIARRIQKDALSARLTMQVHDELILEVADEALEEVKAVIKQEMERAMPELGIPLLVNIDIGRHWSH
eukprot:jgi/Bigna1/125974/aug1.1_g682